MSSGMRSGPGSLPPVIRRSRVTTEAICRSHSRMAARCAALGPGDGPRTSRTARSSSWPHASTTSAAEDRGSLTRGSLSRQDRTPMPRSTGCGRGTCPARGCRRRGRTGSRTPSHSCGTPAASTRAPGGRRTQCGLCSRAGDTRTLVHHALRIGAAQRCRTAQRGATAGTAEFGGPLSARPDCTHVIRSALCRLFLSWNDSGSWPKRGSPESRAYSARPCATSSKPRDYATSARSRSPRGRRSSTGPMKRSARSGSTSRVTACSRNSAASTRRRRQRPCNRRGPPRLSAALGPHAGEVRATRGRA